MKTIREWLDSCANNGDYYHRSARQYAINYAVNNGVDVDKAVEPSDITVLCNRAASIICGGLNTGDYSRVSLTSNAVAMYQAYRRYLLWGQK